MLVSIIVNCYNGEKYLKESIESIISQTYKNWEIIFWDNQSTDCSSTIIKSFKDKRIKYFYANKHESLYSSRNFAITKSSGDLISFLDTDDLWLPSKLETQVKIFRNKTIGVVCSNYYVLNEHFNKRYLMYKDKKDKFIKTNDLLKNYNVGLLTLTIRKELLDQISKPIFDKKYDIIGDFDLVLKLSTFTKIKYLYEPLGYYRKHDSNLSVIKKNDLLIEFQDWDRFNTKKYNFKNYKNYFYISSKLYYYQGLKHIRESKKNKIFNKNFFKINFKYKLILIFCFLIPNSILNRLRII